MLAVLNVEDVWQADLKAEAEKVFGTANTEHPGVAQLLANPHPYYVGGTVEALEPPRHYDYRLLRMTPKQVRERFASQGWRRQLARSSRWWGERRAAAVLPRQPARNPHLRDSGRTLLLPLADPPSGLRWCSSGALQTCAKPGTACCCW